MNRLHGLFFFPVEDNTLCPSPVSQNNKPECPRYSKIKTLYRLFFFFKGKCGLACFSQKDSELLTCPWVYANKKNRLTYLD